MSVICLGELIIDFTSLEKGRPLWAVEQFQKNVGGAPANVAVGLHFHGIPVHLWSKVGNDSFGVYLRRKLQEWGLPIDGIAVDTKHPTKLAFVGLDEKGERFFEFHNRNSAEGHILPTDLPIHQLSRARIFHFGGVALLGETTANTLLQLLPQAQEKGCLISFDPNIRLSLVAQPHKFLERIHRVLPYVHILKFSEEEHQHFFQGKPPEQLLTHPTKLVAITRGKNGVTFYHTSGEVSVPPTPVTVVDTTGAGDAFMAALLAKLYRWLDSHRLEDLPHTPLQEWGEFANFWAGQIIQHHGAVSGYFSDKPRS